MTNPATAETSTAIDDLKAEIASAPRSRLRPVRDLVLLVPVTSLDEARGSIVIPDRFRSPSANRGEFVKLSDQWGIAIVRAVGPGLWAGTRRQPLDLTPGEVVAYRRSEATALSDDLEPWPLVMVHEESIAGAQSQNAAE